MRSLARQRPRFGSERIHKNDQIFVLVRTDDFSALAAEFGVSDAKIQDVMILANRINEYSWISVASS